MVTLSALIRLSLRFIVELSPRHLTIWTGTSEGQDRTTAASGSSCNLSFSHRGYRTGAKGAEPLLQFYQAAAKGRSWYAQQLATRKYLEPNIPKQQIMYT